MADRKSIRIADHFTELADLRGRCEVVYPLINVVMIAVCAVICGADDFVAIASLGKEVAGTISGLGEWYPVTRSFQCDLRRHQAGGVREVSAELDHGLARNHRWPGDRH